MSFSAYWISCDCRYVVDVFLSKPAYGRAGTIATLNRAGAPKTNACSTSNPNPTRDHRPPAHSTPRRLSGELLKHTICKRLFRD